MRLGEIAGITRSHIRLDRVLVAVGDIGLPPFLTDGPDRLLRANP